MTTNLSKLPTLIRLPLGLAASALLLAGCDSEFEPEFDDELEAPAGMDPSTLPEQLEAADPGSEAISGMPGIDEACAEAHMPIIARVDPNAGSCAWGPLPAGWTAERLVDASPWISQAVAAQPLSPESPYREFCKYEYDGNSPDVLGEYEFIMLTLQRWGQVLDPAGVATDCPSVYPLGGLETTETLGAAHEVFRDALDAVPNADIEADIAQETHIYVLDTMQQGFTPFDDHGQTMLDIIDDLYCDRRAGCNSYLHSLLVTPRSFQDDVFSQPDYFNGGNKGAAFELSMGIVTAVQQLREINDDGDPSTLERGVINASIGSSMDLGLYATNPEYAPMQAVLEAARMAACAGVPIYAAAGNGAPVDEPCASGEDGLMFPAALDAFDHPSPEDCSNWGYSPMAEPVLFPITNQDGLVLPVGAVDHLDQHLANDRALAHPAHTATGFFGLGPTSTTPRTGTSVSAAAYSATAALLWAVAPSLPPGELSSVMHDNGLPLGEADAGRHVDNGRSRLSICASLDAMGLNLDCEAQEPEPSASQPFDEASELAITVAAEQNLLMTAPLQTEPPLDYCEDGPQFADLLGPLPTKPGCALCGVDEDGLLSGDDVLGMSITEIPALLDAQVIKAFLYVTDTNGIVHVTNLQQEVLDQINLADSSYVIEVPFDVADPIDTATLDFWYEDVYGQKHKATNSLWVF